MQYEQIFPCKTLFNISWHTLSSFVEKKSFLVIGAVIDTKKYPDPEKSYKKCYFIRLQY